MNKHFTQAALDEIQDNPQLHSHLCELLDMKPAALDKHLERNSEVINQRSVIRAVAQFLGVETETLTKEMPRYAKAV